MRRVFQVGKLELCKISERAKTMNKKVFGMRVFSSLFLLREKRLALESGHEVSVYFQDVRVSGVGSLVRERFEGGGVGRKNGRVCGLALWTV
ncbi:hypothetical protein COLO4_19819 [Corchorus olitorius]|uniref:Uncharacterized protein n=1 Tax=Corchorus olitorius TaxID=93759 RepID=A0A1R3J379_9ROSI|nr:hypothetical protein COLO4_19819 [Corchorus olitorius]